MLKQALKYYFFAIGLCLILNLVLVWLALPKTFGILAVINFFALLTTWRLYHDSQNSRIQYEERKALFEKIEHQVSDKLERTDSYPIHSEQQGRLGKSEQEKNLQHHIYQALEFQELMMSNIPIYIFVKDAEFRIVQANERFFSLYPEDMRSKIIGYTTLESYPADEAKGFLAQDRLAFEQGISQVEETIQFPDGQMRTLFTKKIRFEDEQGNPHILGIAQDITQIVQAREEIEQQRDYFESLIDSLGVATFVIDDTHKVVNWNRACENLSGMMREEVIGTDLHSTAFYKKKRKLLCDMVLDQDFTKVVELYESEPEDSAVIREGKFIENWHDLKNGKRRYLRVFSNPLRKQGKITLCLQMMIDMTELKQSQTLLEQQQEKLADSNRQLEQFAYIASHDLQEPLRMVSSYTQLLADRYRDKLDETAHEFIDFAVDGAVRMQAMIQDLLAYSRVQNRVVQFEPIDANDLYEYAVLNLAVAIDESGTVVEKDGELPVIEGDVSQLRQLFQNLIGNAVKYRDTDKLNRVQVSAIEKDGFWQFCIEDNGIGIAEEHQNRVFEIFKRLHSKHAYKGTGIGLSICKRIVDNHQGEIWVESQSGLGAKFFFTLPKVKTDANLISLNTGTHD